MLEIRARHPTKIPVRVLFFLATLELVPFLHTCGNPGTRTGLSLYAQVSPPPSC